MLKLDTGNAELMNHKDILQNPEIKTTLTKTIQQLYSNPLYLGKKIIKRLKIWAN